MRNFRIRLAQVAFRSPFTRGPERMRFSATIDGVAFGPAAPFTRECDNRSTVALPGFSTLVDLDARPIENGHPKPIDVQLVVQSDEPGGTRNITFRHSFRYPFFAKRGSTAHTAGVASWVFEQQLSLIGPDGLMDPFADLCRESPDGPMESTLGSPETRIHVEAHPVLPHRGGCTPRRPVFPAGTPGPFTATSGVSRLNLANGQKNIIWNPSVIPIMPRGTTLDATNCSNFKVTYYRPDTLNLLEAGDDRLEWRVQPLTGGQAQFFGPVNGRVCSLHGTREGEVMLELRFRGAVVAVYRALVAPLISIPARLNILSIAPTDALFTNANDPAMRPNVTPAMVAGHLTLANKYWWQAGIELYRSRSTAIGRLPAGVTAAAVSTTTLRGVFTAQVPNGLTLNVGGNEGDVGSFNAIDLVANFTYVISTADGRTLGEACLRETQGRATINDRGTPSTSWVRPSGAPPDGDAGTSTMNLRQNGVYNADLGGVHNLYAMYLRNHASRFEYVNTMAHELGHILNLGHRGWDTVNNAAPSVDDNIHWPQEENIMHPDNPATMAQDIDIIQAKAARASKLCTRTRV